MQRVDIAMFAKGLLAVLLLLPTIVVGQQPNRNVVDYLILIDVSGSMEGLPAGSGNANIFDKVQASINEFIGEVEPGANIIVAPFSAGLEGFRGFPVTNTGGTSQAQAYVSGLKATGSATHVYDSIEEAFSRYNSSVRKGEQRVAVLMVFTDGLDNSPNGRTMTEIMRVYGLKRQRHDWIYYNTLGVELSAADREAIEQSGFATYVHTKSGVVKPLITVEPRYPRLDFGNLMTDSDATRFMAFDVRGQSGLPEGFVLNQRTRFDSISEHGAAVEVTPNSVVPSGSATIKLALVNKQSLPHGEYEGSLIFESPNPQVLVVPSEIPVSFRYQPARTVVPGLSNMDLGSANAFRAAGGTDTLRFDLPLTYNSEALSEGGSFTVSIEEDAGASVLPPHVFSINGQQGRRREVAAGEQLQIVATIDENVRPGRYEGRLLLGDGMVEVDTQAREIAWRLKVEERPWSLAQWALSLLSLLAVLFVAVLVVGGLTTHRWPFWKKDRLERGRLTVVAPVAHAGEEVILKGRERVVIGSNGDELSDAGAAVVIRPERTGKAVAPKAVAQDGSPLLKRDGERFGSSFAAEVLHDGDRLLLPPYEIEYSSY